MKDCFLRGLLKILFLFIALDCLAQQDSVLTAATQLSNKKDSSSATFVTVAANTQLKGNGVKRFFIGKNYREEWSTPITVPVLNLNTAYGGLTPTRLGGGKQTKSLRVEDHNGKEWALRSVEKFPDKAVPPDLRKTVAEKIVNDGISASYPYAILSMPVLSRAANVPYLKDTLVYIGDDPALGEFRSIFKNTLALMEEREPSGIITGNDNGKKEKAIETEELVYRLQNDSRIKVDQYAVLRARLLDNFVMDFDRHQGQWIWVGMRSGKGMAYYPVPTDRDQAFYLLSGGLLTKFATGNNAVPQLQGFREKAKDITTFNLPEQSFDRFFLNSLTEEDWSRQIDEFLTAMTDSVIETALHTQPLEIRDHSADKIIEKLKNKRQYFKKDMMKYYGFISRTVSIVGTNEREQFTISKNDNGKISVVVNKIDSAGNVSGKLYERTFDPAITNELRIYGLEGDDKFLLQGEKLDIRTRLIGGPGNDQFAGNDKDGKVVVYDVSFEQNTFSGDQGIRKKISGDPQNNNYTRLEYIYNKSSLGPAVEVSVGGLFVGARFQVTRQGFRKEPFSAKHLFAITRSVNASSYHLKYYGEFIHVFGKTDLLFHSDAWLPTSRTLFFGLGNNTIFDRSNPGGHKYYFDRYNLIEVSLMARNKPASWFEISYGPVFEYFKLKQKPNENKYISALYPPHENFILYTGKSYAGGALNAQVNTKNNQAVPTRGIKLNMYGRSLLAVSKYSNPVTEAGGQLDVFTDFISKRHVVLATSFGASHIAGKFEIQQAQYLGFKQNLRGFRIDRFAGRSRAYNNSEIRFLKRDANLGLFRGTLGLLVFNDIGRVWADNEKSTQWHHGYGWGIVVAPLDKIAINAIMMYSKEEKNLLYINFGFQF